ncbi:hypothetical protein [Marinitoga aeolica]|uniref:DUF2268 domain-containing protein n=1 Tax=Marinitoga aeolica TaxID=2809031 RepID=A0ABY8PSI6_9BACT|nr:hypothetical protein [Marinitoga aeolica]WGS65580.1 hypothetical protein JRV97_03215 [Marinitoga aeolica]
MKINTEIIDYFLKEKKVEGIFNHKIFSMIESGKILFEAPPVKAYERIKYTYSLFMSLLKNFKPCNFKIWKTIFENYERDVFDFTVYFIVGAPSPYDAMIRYDENNNTFMIFDIYQMSNSSMEISKLKKNISLLITHELAHILIHKKYKWPDKIGKQMKYLFFDEGLAHFLSYSENIEKINWKEKSLLEKKNKSYKILKNEMNVNKDKEFLIKGITASNYWDKYIAISGMFAISDFFYYNNNDINSLKDIFKKGPDFLYDFWKKYCIRGE